MPELPEVETIRRTLAPLVMGRTLLRVDLDWPGCVQVLGGRTLESSLPGAQCIGTDRRGKYLLLQLDHDRTLVIHLRMTGRLAVEEVDAPALRHQRAAIAMDDGRSLRFADQRKFGRLALAEGPADLGRLLARLGPEPFDPEDPAKPGTLFDQDGLALALAGRRAAVKAVLLDQRVVAGLGNIYVDEALHLSGVHPATPGGSVDAETVGRLVRAIRAVLAEAIASGGTTLADYRDATGASGAFQARLQVFRRHGKPCPRCATLIVRSVVAQRGTHSCPRCQPPP